MFRKLLAASIVLLTLALYFNSSIWLDIDVGAPRSYSGFWDDLLERVGITVSTRARRFPQCIIIGVKRCGTRALLTFLDLHSDVLTTNKEMHFFDRDENYKKGMVWYRKSMPFSNVSQFTIEKTPNYFVDEKVPERIKMMNSSIKLLVILCNPTVRAISDITQSFYNRKDMNKRIKSPEELVLESVTGEVDVTKKTIKKGTYNVYLSRWFAVFPREQIHVVDGDNFLVDPVSEMEHVENFLGLENQITNETLYFNETKGFFCMRNTLDTEGCLGEKKGRPHVFVPPAIVEKIDDFYRPHNKKLFDMLNRTFNW